MKRKGWWGGVAGMAALGLVMVVSGGAAWATDEQPAATYPELGKHKGYGWQRCLEGSFKRCPGYLPTALPPEDGTPEVNTRLVAFLNAIPLHGRSFTHRRKPASSNVPETGWPVHTITAVEKQERLSYRDANGVNGVNGVVLAKITVLAHSVRDARYGLENLTSTAKDFYLVSSPYSAALNETVDTVLGNRWRIATWSILEINGDAVKRVGNQGRIAWCKHTHDDSVKKDAARFLSCKAPNLVDRARADAALMKTLSDRATADKSGTRPAVGADFDWIVERAKSVVNSSDAASALAGLSAQSRALIQEIALIDYFSDPVWMTCGVGCCIAET